MAQAVSCRYVPMDGWTRFQDIPCWIFYRKNATEVAFSLSTSIFSRQCDSINIPYSFSHLSPTLCNLTNFQCR